MTDDRVTKIEERPEEAKDHPLSITLSTSWGADAVLFLVATEAAN
jgi:hypothetical protein